MGKSYKASWNEGYHNTAKHHDGFALWPSKYTDHSVKNSLWRDGKGDLIDELSKSCKDYGLKLGIYISPWDRNHPDYGKPEYVTYFRNQLRELLTQYGDIFEVWFDGANGGDGYYGGANEIRKVDKKTYYDWPKTIQIVRDLQPKAVIFSDAGPIFVGLVMKKDTPMKPHGHLYIEIVCIRVCQILMSFLWSRKWHPLGSNRN